MASFAGRSGNGMSGGGGHCGSYLGIILSVAPII